MLAEYSPFHTMVDASAAIAIAEGLPPPGCVGNSVQLLPPSVEYDPCVLPFAWVRTNVFGCDGYTLQVP
jgi:hypothetical protein